MVVRDRPLRRLLAEFLTCRVGFLGCFKVAGRLVLGGVVGLGCIRCVKERSMSVRIRRVVVAGGVAAAPAAGPGGALASGSGPPSPSPAPAASKFARAAVKAPGASK